MRTYSFGIITLLAVSIVLYSCNKRSVTGSQSQKENEEKQQTIMESSPGQRNNMFAFDIMKKVNMVEKNSIISPFSINAAIAMTYAGARGETMIEMSEVMYYPIDQDKFHPEFSKFTGKLGSFSTDKAGFKLANALYAQKEYKFLNEFFELIKRNYGSVLNFVDFYHGDREAIRQEINKWVEDQTNNKIQDLIKKNILTEDTRLVLVNAVYFLAEWAKEFDKELSYEDDFHTISNKIAKATYMKTKDDFNFFQNSKLSALELPYNSNKFSMLIVMPEKNHPFKSFIEEFTASGFNEVINGLRTHNIEVHIPKFKNKMHIELQKELAEMGMPLAFSNRADFSGMTGNLELKIDKVIHQAFIEVDEKGTEAAAATAVVMIRKTAVVDPEIPKVFKANRPFLYFIKDTADNTILFMGSLVNPE